MSEILLDKALYSPSPLTGWYREKPFKIALAGSLLIHAALLMAVPGFRAVSIEPPRVLNVELVEEHLPQPEPVPDRRVLQRRPEAVSPPAIEPSAPAPSERNPVRPEPQRALPEPVQPPEPLARDTRPDLVPTPRVEMLPPQPARPDMQPDFPVVLQPEPLPQRSVAPPEQARIELPPEPLVSRVVPSQPAHTVEPRLETAPEPQREMPSSAVRDDPRVVTPAPPQRVAEPQAVPEAERSLLTSYEKSLSDLIKRHERYPDRARRQGWQGTTIVGLSLAADGKVKDVSILESSGREVLDDAALQMVRRASPLPRAPETLQGKERVVRIPIVFRLAT